MNFLQFACSEVVGNCQGSCRGVSRVTLKYTALGNLEGPPGQLGRPVSVILFSHKFI
jgi:hypothetical protein